MCLGIPAKILEINGDIAKVDFGGITREVDISLVDVKLDDYASGTSQHNVDFTISLSGNFLNAVGETQSVSSDPVTLTYDIRSETCDDGTTINTCVFDRTGQEADND